MADNKTKLEAVFELDQKELAVQLGNLHNQLGKALEKTSTETAKKTSASLWSRLGSGAKSAGASIGSALANGIKGALSGIGGVLKSAVGVIASPLTLLAGGAGIAGAGYAIKKVIDLGGDIQDQMVDIRDVSQLTDAQIGALTGRLISFSNETGIAREDLMKLSTVAARLGIKDAEGIERFALSWAKIGKTTNVGTDQAEAVSRLMQSIGENPEMIERFMSATNEISDNMATNETRVLDFVQALVATKTTLKLTSTELLSLAGAFSATSAESGSSGMAANMVSKAMSDAALGLSKDSGKSLAAFAKTAGMTSGAFAKLVKTNGYEALIKFLTGLKDVDAEGGELATMLNDMGLEGGRTLKALLPLSSSMGNVTTALKLSNDQFSANSETQKEFAARTATVHSQMDRIGKSFINFLTGLNDNKQNTSLIKDIADGLQSVMDSYKDSIAKNFRAFIKEVHIFLTTLPERLALVKAVFKQLFTDPQYLNNVFANLASLLSAALIEGFKAFITVLWGMAKFIWTPIFEAFRMEVAEMVAMIPGMGTSGTRIAAGNLSAKDQAAMIPESALAKKAGSTDTYRTGRWRDYYAQNPAEMNKFIGEMSTKEQEDFRTNIFNYRNSPEARDKMAKEMEAQGNTMYSDVVAGIKKGFEKVRAAGGGLYDALATGGAGIESARNNLQSAVNRQMMGGVQQYNEPIGPDEMQGPPVSPAYQRSLDWLKAAIEKNPKTQKVIIEFKGEAEKSLKMAGQMYQAMSEAVV